MPPKKLRWKATAPDKRTVTILSESQPTVAELDRAFGLLPPVPEPQALGGKVGKYTVIVESE